MFMKRIFIIFTLLFLVISGYTLNVSDHLTRRLVGQWTQANGSSISWTDCTFSHSSMFYWEEYPDEDDPGVLSYVLVGQYYIDHEDSDEDFLHVYVFPIVHYTNYTDGTIRAIDDGLDQIEFYYQVEGDLLQYITRDGNNIYHNYFIRKG